MLTAAGLLPLAAQAHLVSTGLGPFYDGLSHFVLSPEDLLPVLTLALLAGLNGAPAGRQVLLALPAAWAVAGVEGLNWPVSGFPALWPGLSFLLLGAMVAADLRLQPGWMLASALLVGGLNGWHNGAAMAEAGLGLPALAGIVGAVFVSAALAAALAVALRAAWARIVVRVAGSWVAAAGLLWLGWTLRAA